MTSNLVIVVAIALCATFATPACAASDSAQVRRYQQILNFLPVGGADNNFVLRVVVKLVNLRPALSAKYYRLGISRLSRETGDAAATATKMALAINKIVKRSNLTFTQIERIEKKINAGNV